MMKNWQFLRAAALALFWSLMTGPFSPAQIGSPAASPSPAKAKAAKPAEPHGPTVITATKDATFDQKANIATFSGAVKVVDPQFTLTCDSLTVYMATEAAKTPGTPTPTATPKNTEPTPDGGGIDHAVAEGNVTILQQKPGENGGAPQINIGKAKRANFSNKTGKVRLLGWPQLQQGISTHIATSEGTIMDLDNAGHLYTDGPSRTVIQDQPEGTPTPAPSAFPASSARSPLLPLGGF